MQEKSSEPDSKSTGRWTKEEHQKFMYAITQYGKDWKKVEQYVGSRSGSQVRSHAQKFFNKLQKSHQAKEGREPRQQREGRGPMEFSETEFDMERQMGIGQATPMTPMELVSLIKKQPKEEGGRVNLGSLKQRLDEQTNRVEGEPLSKGVQDYKSYKSMSNILSAYEEMHEGSRATGEDESFLIYLTKRYKRFFGVKDFDKLIDLNQPPKDSLIQMEGSVRKRSFTLPEGSELQGEQLEQKIEEIKKQIRSDDKKIEQVQLGRKEEQIVAPEGLNRLSTIQEQHGDDEQVAGQLNSNPHEK